MFFSCKYSFQLKKTKCSDATDVEGMQSYFQFTSAVWQYLVSNDTDFSIQYHHPGTWYQQYQYLVLGIAQHYSPPDVV